jgi:hypothetical protein
MLSNVASGEQEEVDPHDQRQLDALRVLQQGFSSSSFSSLNNTERACRPDASKPRAPTLDAVSRVVQYHRPTIEPKKGLSSLPHLSMVE